VIGKASVFFPLYYARTLLQEKGARWFKDKLLLTKEMKKENRVGC